MWYQFFKYGFVRPGVKVLMAPRLEGAQNIPEHGPAILAANHLDAADTFSLPALITRQLTFPAKQELFTGRGIRGRSLSWFLRAVGQVPMDRSGGYASAHSLGPVLQVLADGGLVGIFPEGSRSPDGRLYRGHTGVARMALAAGVPVIPVGMINTQLRKGALGLPTMDHGRIVIGKPIDYSPWHGQADRLGTLRWITDDVMAKIQELTAQDYVDVYSSRVKHGNLKGADLSRYLKPSPLTGSTPPPTDEQLAQLQSADQQQTDQQSAFDEPPAAQDGPQ